MEAIGGLLFFIFIIFLYFLPTFVASKRRHKEFMPILLVNLFFGWTGIGWLIALIWSFTSHVYKENETA